MPKQIKSELNLFKIKSCNIMIIFKINRSRAASICEVIDSFVKERCTGLHRVCVTRQIIGQITAQGPFYFECPLQQKVEREENKRIYRLAVRCTKTAIY